MSFLSKIGLPLLALYSVAQAQTSTDCNPTETTCSNDVALDKTTFVSTFTDGSSSNTSWTATAGTITYGDEGAEFTINEKGDAPTIETDFYIFFGTVEVVLKAANGTGIVSSVVLESDDLDEIDWEWLGGDTTQVQTDYFGKGNTTSYDRGGYSTVSTPQDTFHTYTITWSNASIVWSIDGTAVRTLAYEDALDGKNYPQTPMRVKLGIWAGGDSDNAAGTIEWAGGETDYDDAPFTMYVKSVTITNANPGAEYEYTDTSGDYTSIKVISSSDSTDDDDTTATESGTSTATQSTSGTAAASSKTTATEANIAANLYANITGKVTHTVSAPSNATATATATASATGNASLVSGWATATRNSSLTWSAAASSVAATTGGAATASASSADDAAAAVSSADADSMAGHARTTSASCVILLFLVGVFSVALF